jgi:hypothetical protein
VDGDAIVMKARRRRDRLRCFGFGECRDTFKPLGGCGC